jgi:hypothetical protein
VRQSLGNVSNDMPQAERKRHQERLCANTGRNVL